MCQALRYMMKEMKCLQFKVIIAIFAFQSSRWSHGEQRAAL